MSEKYFGKGCEHFSGQWETYDVQADDTGEQKYKEWEPVLKYCSHPNNKKDHEGNCHESICPLGLKNERT